MIYHRKLKEGRLLFVKHIKNRPEINESNIKAFRNYATPPPLRIRELARILKIDG